MGSGRYLTERWMKTSALSAEPQQPRVFLFFVLTSEGLGDFREGKGAETLSLKGYTTPVSCQDLSAGFSASCLAPEVPSPSTQQPGSAL